MLRATGACTFFDISTSKSGWKCGSRHNSVHFLNISTSKSGSTLVCFVHFDLDMCFGPGWRALFRHHNFQKGPECEVLLPFLLANVLLATTARNVSSLIWPAGSAPAALASLPFDPSEPQTVGKNTVNRDFLPLSRNCIFFLLTISPL